MRVLLLSAAYPPHPGGVATHVGDLAHALVHLGHDVFVQAASVDEHHSTSGHGRLKIWKEARESIRAFDGRRLFGERVLQRLLDRWCIIKPDLIHAHDSDSMYLAWSLKAVTGCPVVATIHRAPSPWRRLKFMENPKDLFLEALGRQETLDCLVVPSAASAAVLHSQGFGASHPSTQVVVIPHGIRPFLRAEADRPEIAEQLTLGGSRQLILCPGRADEHKDLDTFIEAASKLKASDALPPLAFLVCCDSDDPFYERARRLAQELGLEEDQDIVFRKFAYQEMATVYRCARVAIMTSRHEAFGLTVLEAFLFDVPVVASNTSALREIVHNGTNGLLYTDGDSRDLARQVTRVLTDANLERRIVDAGRGLLRDNGPYAVETMASAYDRLYKTLASSGQPKEKGRFFATPRE